MRRHEMHPAEHVQIFIESLCKIYNSNDDDDNNNKLEFSENFSTVNSIRRA